MKVVLCDDENTSVEYLSELVMKQPEMEILGVYTSQKELLKWIESGENADVVFMDIDWKEQLSGIQLSKLLFEKCPSTQIIYVTGYNNRFSQQIFLADSNLCGYLVKPVDEKILVELIEKAKKRISAGKRKFVFLQRGEIISIPYTDICYLESDGHHVILYTIDKKVQLYGKLSACMDKLSPAFVQSHKSFVVNMEHITYIDKNEIILDNGEKVTISKSRYQDFRKVYFNYISNR